VRTFFLPCYIRPLDPNDEAQSQDGPADAASALADRFERETIDILKRLTRRPIDPAPAHELMADLGFDSLQILELVGELEDRFDIAIPLNSLTHIRTVGQIVTEVRALAAERTAP
jgi:acyl carrier protein